MTDLDDEDVSAKPSIFHRCLPVARKAVTLLPSIISIGCAVAAGYFSYVASHEQPPADMSKLAISILKSDDTSPEMRDWATAALGIQTDVPLTN
jgi:hypothetical protein